MASTISAGTTSSTALVATADTSGSLVLQTNNGTTALTLSTAQVATFAQPVGGGMTVQVFTSGSGTYTTPSGCKAIWVRAVGGGGGGGGSGSSPAASTAGGNTTFSTLTASGGALGPVTANQGGVGGSASGGNINAAGGQGQFGGTAGGGINVMAGYGGASHFGQGGPGGYYASGVGYAGTGYGAAGGGGGPTATANGGSGGGGGGYTEKLIVSPAATYSYAVGAAGTAGGAGGSGLAGGAGTSGMIIVTEFYV